MKRSFLAWTPAILLAVVIASVLVAGSAVAQEPPPLSVTVTYWGQSEINEDGNLRFRISGSATGIAWTGGTGEPDPDVLQLWAHISGGPASSPVDKLVLIKSKTAYNRYGAATAISGTSARVPLRPGTYTYELFVVLTDMDGTELAKSEPHPAGTVTLP